MTQDESCPRPLSKVDAAAIIGVLATLNGEITVRGIDGHEFEMFRDRAVSDGMVSPGEGHYELRQALEDLTQRVRYALGEYEHPPKSEPVDPSPTWSRGRSPDGRELRIERD
jgi:hypothetical protein